jgi:hypothetical protein
VELVIERKGEEAPFVDQGGGGPRGSARLAITLDGYSAPLTAGNFAANVQDGLYNGKQLNTSYASVLAGRDALPGERTHEGTQFPPLCGSSQSCMLACLASAGKMQSALPGLTVQSHRAHALNSLSIGCCLTVFPLR